MYRFNSKGRASQFNPAVLKEKDINGDIIGAWCEAGSKKEEAVCHVCNRIINCSQHGVSAIKRHASSKGHMDSCANARNKDGIIRRSTQPKLTFCHSSTTHSDKVCTAETMFCVAVAAHSLPYTFANTATSLFSKIFSDSEIAKDFKCRSSKLSYVISDGLGPYLQQKIIEEVFKIQCGYSIQIDETPIPEKRIQQLDILLRYFSEEKEQVVVHHWETFHIGSATSDNIVSCVVESLQSLPSNKLLSVFSDGPNVMKSVKNKFLNLHPEMLDIGECVLHKVHNSFAYGLNSFGDDVENLVIDIFYFFKRSSAQSTKLKNLQIKLGLPENVFLRHVNSRWLTLQTSIARVIEQFPVLQEYFKKCTESKCDSQRLNKISQAFVDKTLFAKLLFLQNASKIFTHFLTIFQVESPMIHVLYDEMVTLIKTIMGRFLKEECFRNKIDLKLVDVEKGSNWGKLDIGSDTEKAIGSLSEKERKCIHMGARSFYISSVKYLLKTLPLNNKILKSLKCLHNSMHFEEQSLPSFKFLAVQLPNIIAVEDISNLCDEFLRLQGEEIPICVANTTSPNQNDSTFIDDFSEGVDVYSAPKIITESIDKYWARVLKIKDITGAFKYQKLGKLVKALLSLPHGNADVERGFSTNKNLLMNRCNLNVESINALRKIKSHIKFNCENKVEEFKVNSGVLKYVKNSHQRKCERLKALQQQKRKIESTQSSEKCFINKLKEEEKELGERLKAAQKMLDNAQQGISAGIKTSDMATIESGRVLLVEAALRVNTILTAQEKNRQELMKLHCGAKKSKF